MKERIGLVDKGHGKVSVRRQCELLGVARSSVDYEPVAEPEEDLQCKRVLDELHLTDPCPLTLCHAARRESRHSGTMRFPSFRSFFLEQV